MKKYLIYIIVLSSCVHAQDALKRQFDYADKLYANGLFYEAITEFKRLQFFDEGSTYSYQTHYRIGLCYKAGAKLDDAVKYFSLAEKFARTDDELFETKTQVIRTNILRKTTGRALQLLNELESDSLSTAKTDEINYWLGWAYMFVDDWEKAASTFGKINPSHELKRRCENVLNEKYSVTFAKIISYILPGAGQFYTGNYLSGLLSLGWNVLCGFLTVDSIIDDRIFDGVAVGSLLWLRFYRGNVQNAEKFAVQKNVEIANKTLHYLQKEYTGLKP
jgi:tetratricopeptide (TPR) repeat protein